MSVDLVLLGDQAETAAWADLVAAAPATVAGPLGLAHEVRDGIHRFSAPPVPQGLFNRVVGLDHAPRSDDALDELLAWACAASPDPWLQIAEREQTLRERLARRGWVPAERPTWAKVVRDTSPYAARSSLTAFEVDGREAAALGAVVAAAHGLPPPVAAWVAALVGRPSWYAFGLRDAPGTIVGGGFVHCGDRSAWFGLGGTLASHRRRGGQGALFAARLARAAEVGIEVCVTETGEPVGDESNPSLANMYRAGFRKVSSRHNLRLRR